jgi:hypothetical protein
MPEDYLLRLARQVAQLLTALGGLRKEGRQEEARREIERLCLDSIGLPWKQVRQSSPEALLEHLRGAGALRHHRAVLLAELLLQEAEMAEIDGQVTDAIRARLQAFCLISDVIDMLSNEDLAVYRDKLELLAAQLEPMSAHPYLAEKLRAFREGRPRTS